MLRSVPSAFLLGPPVLFPLPLACRLGFCVVSSRVRSLVCGLLYLAPPSGRGFSFSLSIAAVLRSSRVEKEPGPGPARAERSLGVWGRAPGLLNGLVFCAVGGFGGACCVFSCLPPLLRGVKKQKTRAPRRPPRIHTALHDVITERLKR